MKKVALITYHAAYNFGSMLQAFATQETLKRICGNCTIINYRLPTQKIIYSVTKNNKLTNPQEYEEEINSMGILYSYRVIRDKRFNSFFKHYKLTKEFNHFEPCLKEMEKYDILVSGSDQILNKNTVENSTMPFDFMRPYLLDVKGKNKVSFSSSFCNLNNEQLEQMGPYLNNFNHFSVREKSWIEKAQPFCKTPVINTCDPSFLLSKEEWIKKLKLKKYKNKEKYILFYTLYDYRCTVEKLEILLSKLKYFDIKIHVVAPFCEHSLANIDPRIVECLEFGPKQFLEDLYNAEFVIPESFHGTTFCTIFNKRFVCPCGNEGPELRKIEALESVGLQSQLRPNFWEISLKDIFEDFDYTNANRLIEENKNKAITYLKTSMGIK